MRRLTVCALLLALGGCGGSKIPYTDHSRDPERFAVNVKQMVFGVVAESRRSGQPGDSVQLIVDTFDGRLGKLPVGQYLPIYEELLTQARELYEACEAAEGRPPDLERRLDVLWAVAVPLPGDESGWRISDD